MNKLERLRHFFGGEIYKDICVIVKCGMGWNAYFPNESDSLYTYDSKKDLISDIELLRVRKDTL